MSDTFGTVEAVSQGNALTNEAMQHNDAIKVRNQEIMQTLNSQKATLDGQKQTDKYMHDVSDVYSVGSALNTSYKTYGAVQKAGGFRKYVQGEGGIGNAKKVFNSMSNFSQKTRDPTSDADPQPTPLEDTANTQGTAADAPVTPEERPAAPAPRSGTSAPPTGEAEVKPPKSAGELFEAAGDTAGKIGTGLGAVSAVGSIAEDISQGKIAGDNVADKVSNVASIAAGALDVASIFLPVLAPAAAAASAISAISGGVGEIEDIADKEDKDASQARSMKGTETAPVGLASAGLVANQVTDNTKSIGGTGAF